MAVSEGITVVNFESTLGSAGEAALVLVEAGVDDLAVCLLDCLGGISLFNLLLWLLNLI